MAEWLRQLSFSALNRSSSHRCGFEPSSGHVRQAKFCLWMVRWFFSGISCFRPTYRLTQLKMSEIVLTGCKTQICKKKKKTIIIRHTVLQIADNFSSHFWRKKKIITVFRLFQPYRPLQYVVIMDYYVVLCTEILNAGISLIKRHWFLHYKHGIAIVFILLAEQIWASSIMRLWYLSHWRPAKAQAHLRIRSVSPEPSLLHTWSMEVDEGSDQKTDIWPHWMAAHARLMNEFTEDEKCHISWDGSYYIKTRLKLVNYEWKFRGMLIARNQG